MAAWLDCGEKIHTMYKELLNVGSALMRVEDHLTMGIPGADVELETVKNILTGLMESADEVLEVVNTPTV